MATAVLPLRTRETPVQSIEHVATAAETHTTDVNLPEFHNDATYVFMKGHKPWTAVLCDASIAPRDFMAKGPPTGMIRPRPAIQLGRRKFIWVDESTNLFPYDPTINYLQSEKPFEQPDILQDDDSETRIEKQRRKGFTQDAGFFKDAAFWKNVIVQAEEYREVQYRRLHKDSQESRKRSSSTDATYQESEWSTPSKKHKSSFSPIEKQHPVPPYTKPKDELEDALTRDELKRAQAAFNVPKLDNTCTILVAQENGKFPFTVNRRRLHECAYLQTLESKGKLSAALGQAPTKDETDCFIVNLTTQPEHKTITPKSFIAVFDYLRTGDMGPKSAAETFISGPPHLTSKEKSHWSSYLARGFMTARILNHEPLQKLIWERIDALPIDARSVLNIARIVKDLGEVKNYHEKKIKAWVRRHISTSFWSIAEREGGTLQRVLEQDGELRGDVYKTLTENGEMGKVDL